MAALTLRLRRRLRRRGSQTAKGLIPPPVQRRYALAGDFLDIPQKGAFVLGAECDSRPLRSGSRRPTDAVNIALGNIRQLELNDMRNAGDVDPSCCNIRRNKRPHLPGLKGSKGSLTLILTLVAMYRRGRNSGTLKYSSNLVSASLGAREHENTPKIRPLEQLDQQTFLAGGLYEHDLLINSLSRRRLGGD